MNDIVLAVLAIVIGGLFCFRGYLTMRVVIPIWGGFAGFVLGASVVAGVADEGVLQSFTAWAVGIVVGVLFAVLAYAYYEISIILGMATIGFVLGTSVMIALNVQWNWLVILVGVLVAVVLAVAAIVADLPMLLLTMLSALAGASAIVGGVMLLVGDLDSDDLTDAAAIDAIAESPGWWVLYVIIALFGIGSQIRTLRTLESNLRQQWAASGGRQLQRS